MTPLETGAMLLAAGLTFYWLGIFPVIRALLLLVGVIVVGTGGHLLGWAATLIGWISSWAGTATAWAVGVAVPGLLAVILVIVLVHDLHPKNPAGTRTAWVALALGLMIATGTTGIGTLNGIGPSVTSGVTTVTGGP